MAWFSNSNDNKKIELPEIDFSKGFEIIKKPVGEHEQYLEDEINRRIEAGRVVRNVSFRTSGTVIFSATVVYDLWAERQLRLEKEREEKGLGR